MNHDLTIDLNADLGEGSPDDAVMMGLASSVNIACGGHAGDAASIRHAITLALEAGCAIGAHPGYEDPNHFGRRPLDLPQAEVEDQLRRQLQRFITIATASGAAIHHVKPHGALYLQACSDVRLAAIVCDTIARLLPGTMVYAPAASTLANAAAQAGLAVVAEAFADRRYLDDGSLAPRNHPDAVITDPDKAVAQALRIVGCHEAATLGGSTTRLPARTLCVHGDGRSAAVLMKRLRGELTNTGWTIAAP